MSGSGASTAPSHTWPLVPEAYSILEPIGLDQSGNPLVFNATVNTVKGDRVAIHQISTDGLFRNQAALDTLIKSLHVACDLRHPNLLTHHCAFVSSIPHPSVWIVSPLMLHGSLRGILDVVPLDEASVAFILREVLKALEYMHACGYVHNHIQARHVYVDQDGSVRLGGFLCAERIVNASDGTRIPYLHKYHSRGESAPWMSPEYLMQDLRGYNQSSDIYSIGILAYELAYGIHPYHSMERQQIFLLKAENVAITFQPLRDNKPISKQLKDFIERCVRQPSKRDSIQALLQHPLIKTQSRKGQASFCKLLAPLLPLHVRIQAQPSSHGLQIYEEPKLQPHLSRQPFSQLHIGGLTSLSRSSRRGSYLYDVPEDERPRGSFLLARSRGGRMSPGDSEDEYESPYRDIQEEEEEEAEEEKNLGQYDRNQEGYEDGGESSSAFDDDRRPRSKPRFRERIASAHEDEQTQEVIVHSDGEEEVVARDSEEGARSADEKLNSSTETQEDEHLGNAEESARSQQLLSQVEMAFDRAASSTSLPRPQRADAEAETNVSAAQSPLGLAASNLEESGGEEQDEESSNNSSDSIHLAPSASEESNISLVPLSGSVPSGMRTYSSNTNNFGMVSGSPQTPLVVGKIPIRDGSSRASLPGAALGDRNPLAFKIGSLENHEDMYSSTSPDTPNPTLSQSIPSSLMRLDSAGSRTFAPDSSFSMEIVGRPLTVARCVGACSHEECNRPELLHGSYNGDTDSLDNMSLTSSVYREISGSTGSSGRANFSRHESVASDSASRRSSAFSFPSASPRLSPLTTSVTSVPYSGTPLSALSKRATIGGEKRPTATSLLAQSHTTAEGGKGSSLLGSDLSLPNFGPSRTPSSTEGGDGDEDHQDAFAQEQAHDNSFLSHLPHVRSTDHEGAGTETEDELRQLMSPSSSMLSPKPLRSSSLPRPLSTHSTETVDTVINHSPLPTSSAANSPSTRKASGSSFARVASELQDELRYMRRDSLENVDEMDGSHLEDNSLSLEESASEEAFQKLLAQMKLAEYDV